jgi:hypothetical protein
MVLRTYIMAPKTVSTAYFLNLSHLYVCLYVYPISNARQRLCETVTAATNAHEIRIVVLVNFYVARVV